MKLIDLCCCAGLASDGYLMAGFDVSGSDNAPQAHYPYPFEQSDVIEYLWSDKPEEFDAIHVSPPCQLFSITKNLRNAQGLVSKETVDYLTPTIELLRHRWNHKAWVVENVPAAKSLMVPKDGENLITLCGSTFYLKVQRHRLFLSNVPLRQPKCDHSRFEPDPDSGKPRPWGVFHTPGDKIPKGGRTALNAEHARDCMGSHRLLPWNKVKEGLPPAYTAHIGADLLLALSMKEAA